MSDPAVAEVPAQPSAEGKSPLRKTVGDIIRSMGIVGGIIGLVLLVTWRPPPDPVREVDSAPIAIGVAAAADFPVLYPDVPEGWRSTTARFSPTPESGDDPVWFNGWVTPSDGYAAVIQSQETDSKFISEQTLGGQDAEDVPADLNDAVKGWDTYISSDGTQRSFVQVENGVTTIVTGTLEWSDLASFAATLRPVDVPAAP